MRYSEKEYINAIGFDDRDVDIRCETVKIVKVRKDHPCHLGVLYDSSHDIKKGEMARAETALIDKEFWSSLYCCIPCLDKVLSELNNEQCECCRFWDYNENEDEDNAICASKESEFGGKIVNWESTCSCFEEMKDMDE